MFLFEKLTAINQSIQQRLPSNTFSRVFSTRISPVETVYNLQIRNSSGQTNYFHYRVFGQVSNNHIADTLLHRYLRSNFERFL